MLTIETKTTLWDEETNEFQELTVSTLEFEHSLASVSKWEGKWEKAFLSKEQKTPEEIADYIVCMCLTPEATREQILALPQEKFAEINAYIESQQTATVFPEQKNHRPKQQRVTAELIYYKMTAFQIPWEAQFWHLNKLIALIRVFDSKQPGNQKKMSRHELAQRNQELNAARRAELGTTG